MTMLLDNVTKAAYTMLVRPGGARIYAAARVYAAAALIWEKRSRKRDAHNCSVLLE